jgi:hypothetical protein
MMGLERMGAALVLAAGLAVLTGCAGDQAAPPQAIQKGGDERTGEYNAVPGWWKPAPDHDENWTWGYGAAVAADTPNRIIIGLWGDRELPVVYGASPEALTNTGLPQQRPGGTNYVVDGDGNIIERWSQWDSLFNRPHAI